ncbi:tetratricopeptide repeat-containing glycosyltransferase family 2 protein [Clostridium ihumii]|uniref:tetratricopeptide repeat-containing glycosyltransferase family 2 protein n=1 Tax=Clostridium ihumii TaxID=1470356 RepID=UPI00058E186A|nr:glycosyltransferase [Clostridium ihumii]
MLSLCMIVKDEEIYIEKCLRSVNKMVDEIIIVDTGSKDKTKEIALKYTDKVYDFKWCDDFARARNFSLSKSLNDWILVLDADEFICDINVEEIENFCVSLNNNKTGRIKIQSTYEDIYGVKKSTEKISRIFNKNYFKYEGIIHEQLVHKNKDNYSHEDVPITVEHLGYTKDILYNKNKVERNIKLLNKAINYTNGDPYLYYQLGKSYFIDRNYNESYKHFEKAILLLDKYDYEYVEDLIESYGYSLLNMNLFDKAKEIIKFKELYKNSADFTFLLALIEMNNCNFQGAVQYFLECTKFKISKIEGVNSFLALYNIGVIFECLGLKDEAVKYYAMCGDYIPAKKRIEQII